MIRKFKFFEGIHENTFVFNDINLTARHVQRGERTLRAIWTDESALDLNTYHAIDAEAELTRILADEMLREWDNEVITELTRRINGGDNLTDNANYLNRWLDIGNNQRA